MILMTQKTNKNIIFERLGLIATIIIDYYNIFVNILYFSAVIMIKIFNTVHSIAKISKIIINCWNLFYLIIGLSFFSLFFFSNFHIKNCFIGSCIVDRDLKYYLQIFPYKIEFVFFIALFSLVGYKSILNRNNESSNSGIEIFTKQSDENLITHNMSVNSLRKMSSRGFGFGENSQRKSYMNVGEYLDNLFVENCSFPRILIYEIFYFLINSVDFMSRYYKIAYLNNYRYEDYCTIHDYHVIIKSVLILIFVINFQDCREWGKAFKDENMENNNIEADILVNAIGLKNKLKNKKPSFIKNKSDET
jgi:hypothetical protein